MSYEISGDLMEMMVVVALLHGIKRKSVVVKKPRSKRKSMKRVIKLYEDEEERSTTSTILSERLQLNPVTLPSPATKRLSILALSRQKLAQLLGTSIEGVEKGGYVISDNSSANKSDYILMCTGSKLEIAEKAAGVLRKDGKTVGVISIVSYELFDEQSDEDKESVLPVVVTAWISIEAGSTLGWEKFVGSKGKAIGIDRFGASAPAGKIYKEFGITIENIVATTKTL